MSLYEQWQQERSSRDTQPSSLYAQWMAEEKKRKEEREAAVLLEKGKEEATEVETPGLLGAAKAKFTAGETGMSVGQGMFDLDYNDAIALRDPTSSSDWETAKVGTPAKPDILLRGKEAEDYIAVLRKERDLNAAKGAAYDKQASWLGEGVTDVAAGPENLGSIAGAAIGGIAGSIVPGVGTGAGGLAGAGLGAIPQARKAFYNEYAALRELGMDKEDAARGAAIKTGNEYIWELIPGLGKVAKLGKTEVGKTLAKGVVEAATEGATELGSAGIELAGSKLAGKEATREAYAEQAPKTVGEALERARKAAVAGGIGGTAIGAPTSFAEVRAQRALAEAEARDTFVPTGDPEVDAGQQIGNEIARQEARKVSDSLPLISPEQQQLFGEDEVVIGDLFDERSPVKAAEAEIARAKTATASELEDVGGTKAVKPQTTDEQAAKSAKAQEAAQVEKEQEAQDRLGSRRTYVSSKTVKEAAEAKAIEDGLEAKVRKSFADRFPLAFTRSRTTEANRQRNEVEKLYPKALKEAMKDRVALEKDTRLDQIEQDKKLVADRQKAFEQEQYNKFNRKEEKTPEQGELLTKQPTPQQDMFGDTPKDAGPQRPKSYLSRGGDVVDTDTGAVIGKGKPVAAQDSAPAGVPTALYDKVSSVIAARDKKQSTLAKRKATVTEATAIKKAMDQVSKETPELTGPAYAKAVAERVASGKAATAVAPELAKATDKPASKEAVTNVTESLAAKIKEVEEGKTALDITSQDLTSDERRATSHTKEQKAKLKETLKVAKTGRDLGTILKAAFSRSKDPNDHRGRLLDALMSTNTLDDVSVEIVESDHDNLEGQLTAMTSARGRYEPGPKRVLLRGSSWKGHGMTAEVILHELVHGAVDNKYVQAIKGAALTVTVTARQAAQKINLIATDLKQLHSQKKLNLRPGEQAIVDQALKEVGGFSGRELITMATTNPEMIAILKRNHRTTNGNLWTRTKAAMRELLNLDSKAGSYFEEILESTIELAKSTPEQAITEATQRGEVEEIALNRDTGPKQDFEDAVFTEKQKKADVTDTRATGFVAGLRKVLGSRGNNTALAQEAIDWMHQTNEAVLAGTIQPSRIRLEGALDKAGYQLKPDDYTDAGIAALRTKHPDVANELATIKREINLLTLKNAKAYVDGARTPLSEKEVAVLNKMLSNMDEYLTRVYRYDLGITKNKFGRTLGESYSRNIIEAYKHKPESELAKVFREAKDFIKEHTLGFSDNWQSTYSTDRLKDLYKLWKGKDFASIQDEGETSADFSERNRETLVEALAPIAERSDAEMDSHAEALTYQLLGRGPDGDKLQGDTAIQKFFGKDSALDKTIITPRKDVPPAIRNLWGEVRDPLAAMYITAGKLSALLAKQQYFNSELERGQGTFLFSPDQRPADDKFSEQIPSGQEFGALAGLWTTPRYAQTLRLMVKASDIAGDALIAQRPEDLLPVLASKGFIKVARPILRLTKWGDVVLNPMNSAYNFAGSFLNLAMNGNTDVKSMAKGMKAAKKIIVDARMGKVDHDTVELYIAGMMDSALVGELKRDIGRGLYDDIIRSHLKAMGDDVGVFDKMVNWADGKRVAGTELATDIYAMMDLWAKFANYQKDKKVLEGFYQRNNIPYTQESLLRAASEKAKRNNLTQIRAPVIVRAAEGSGITTFALYFSETIRAASSNIMTGIHDLALAKKYGDTKLAMDAVKRLAGTSAALTGNTFLLSGYASLVSGTLALAGHAISSEDEEETEKIKKGLGDFGKGKVLLPMGKDKDGNPFFFEVSRFDPNDPFANPARLALDGDIEGAMKAVASLQFLNPALRGAIDSASGSRPKETKLERQTPAVYEKMREYLDKYMSWADPDVRERFLLATEQPVPNLYTAVWEANINDTQDPFIKNLSRWGMKPIVFNIDKEAQRAGRSYTGAITDIRSSLRGEFTSGAKVDDAKLEGLYLSGLTKELEAYSKVRTYVEAAKASGLRSTQVYAKLKESGMSNDALTQAMSGRFRSRFYTPETLDTLEQELASRIESKERTLEVRNSVRNLNTRLRKLQAKYRNFNGQEN